jgi:hypothetical protein
LLFATPEILDSEEHEGVLITYERELSGAPLRPDSAITGSERDLPSRDTDALEPRTRLARTLRSDSSEGTPLSCENSTVQLIPTAIPAAIAGFNRGATTTTSVWTRTV